MAAAGNALRLCLRTCRRSSAPRIAAPPARLPLPPAPRRTFATTLATRAPKDEEGEEGEGDDIGRSPYEHVEDVFKDMSPEELKQLEDLFQKESHDGQPMTLARQLEEDREELRKQKQLDAEYKRFSRPQRPNKTSFWYDEDDPDTVTENVGDEFDEDDITSLAHGKLDEVREHRHYARIIAWEMPLLSKLAKPFETPTKDQFLRFRYTTYMGEYHPAEKKVVVEFCPADLDLSPVQADKLRKLSGTRYNPEKDVVKMSCESFDQAAQNKLFLIKQVDKLITAAKDPTDTFEDVPLDTRHHKFKPKPKFPHEWRMTAERKKELQAIREQTKQLESAKAEKGELVDGVETIQTFLNPPAPEGKSAESGPEAALAELVAARPKAPKRGLGKPARRL